MTELEVWLNFIESIVASTAWPFFVFAIFLFLRKPLIALAKSMKSIRHGDTEFSFETNLDAFLGTARDLGVTQVYPSLKTELRGWSTDELRGRIISDWQVIEKMMRDWLENHEPAGANPRGLRSVPDIIRQLAFMGIIDPNLQTVIDSFRQLRNQVAHSSGIYISEIDMLETVSTAQSIKQRLGSALSRASELPAEQLRFG